MKKSALILFALAAMTLAGCAKAADTSPVQESDIAAATSATVTTAPAAATTTTAETTTAAATTTAAETTVTTTVSTTKITTTTTPAAKKTTTSKKATTVTTTKAKAVVTQKMSGTMYTNQAANMRKGNGTNYDKVTTLPMNTAVTITGKCDNGWYAVTADGKSGYMSGSVLSSEKTVVTTTAKQDSVSSQEKESGKVMYTGDYLTEVFDKTGQIFQNWRIPAGSKVILYSVEVVPYTDPGGQSGGAVEVAKISYNGKICYVDYAALIESKEEELSPLWKLSEEARNKNISQAEKDKIAKSIAKEIAKEVISEAGSEHSAQQLIVATQKTHDRIYEPYGFIHTEDDPQDWTAYSLFVAHRGSCAGHTRALGLVLDELGYEWEHINEDQWTHQFCKVKVKWKSKDRSKSGDYLYADTYTNIVTSNRSILEGDTIIDFNFSEEFL